MEETSGPVYRVATSHSFRHGAIARIIEKTGDLRAAQLIAGHADVRTRQGYTHLGDEHLREILQKVFGNQ